MLRQRNHRRRAATRAGANPPRRFERLEDRRLLTAASEEWGPLAAEGEGAPMPDFALIDVNQTSATYNQNVSPRDYLGQVTGWYFGHGL
jgi:hypothetical protein